MPSPGSGLCLEGSVEGQISVDVEAEDQLEVRDAGLAACADRRRSFDLRLLSHVGFSAELYFGNALLYFVRDIYHKQAISLSLFDSMSQKAILINTFLKKGFTLG